jgi:hypothetical protein
VIKILSLKIGILFRKAQSNGMSTYKTKSAKEEWLETESYQAKQNMKISGIL